MILPRVTVEYAWCALEDLWYAEVVELRNCRSHGATVEEARQSMLISMLEFEALAGCTWAERFTRAAR